MRLGSLLDLMLEGNVHTPKKLREVLDSEFSVALVTGLQFIWIAVE